MPPWRGPEAAACTSEAEEKLLNLDVQSRRIERQRAVMKNPDFDPAFLAPMMVDHDTLLGVDDQIVP